MKKKTTLELVEQSEKVSFYSISFAADRTTEFELFIREFEDEAILNKDYQRILDSGRIRLSCLRISDEILIIGNGGKKTAQKYEDDAKLFGYALDLQKFDALLRRAIDKGYVTIEEKEFNSIEDKEFYI